MNKSESTSKEEIFDFYKKRNTGFDEILNERTESEVAYDNVILDELRKGSTIREALDIATKKYPKEALRYDDDNIDDLHAHYEYLRNHEIIKNRIDHS